MTKRILLFAIMCSILLAGCSTMKGNTAIRNGNYPEAITAFKEYLTTNPNDWAAHEKLGYAYMMANEPKNAVGELEKAIAIGGKQASMSQLYLGLAYLKMDDQGAALTAWRAFNDKSKPLVQEEVDRLITLVEIENSKKMAKQAMAQEAKLSAADVKPNSYAVFNFGLNGQDRSLPAVQKALTAMTITDLAQIKSITVIERARLQALLDEMKLGQTGAVDPATAPKAGKLLGAENLVVGSLSDPSGKVGVASSTASSTRGVVTGSFGLTQEKDKFYDLQKQVVANIIKVNNIKLDENTQQAVSKVHSRSYEAVTFFGQGLDAQDRGDYQTSKDYFALAVKEDPTFKLAETARDRSPAGISVGITGPVSNVAVNAITAAVKAQDARDSSTVGKFGLGGGSGGAAGGGGGHGGGGGGGGCS